MQRLKKIVLNILILIVGIPAMIAPLHIFFILLDGDFDDWFAGITETGIYTNKRIERLYSLDLRAAQTAYNVKRYDLAIPYFESAINIADTDTTLNGVNLYQYADCLEKTGETEKSKLYFQRAFNELSEFYPNHTLLDELRARGYKKNN